MPGFLSLSYYDNQRLWMNGVAGTFMSCFQNGIELVTRSSERKFVKRVSLNCVDEKMQMSRVEASSSSNWYKCPYVHMIVMRCRNSQQYRQTGKSYLKHLIDDFEKRNFEWFILYIYSNKHLSSADYDSDLEEQQKIYRTIKKSFCARDSGEHRCCWMDISSAKNSPSDSKPELKEAQKKDQALRSRILIDAVSRTFQRRRKKYERELEILRDGMENENWDICRFFITSESFAKMFEYVHLFEDALHLYDALERISAERASLSGRWMKGKILECQSGSDVLRPSPKQRTQIQEYSISRADFMQYLFARQCHLLLCSGDVNDIAEIAERGVNFLASFGPVLESTMTEQGQFADSRFINIWLYSATLAIAQKCHRQLAKLRNDAAKLLAPKRSSTFQDFSLKRDLKRAHVAIATLFRLAIKHMLVVGEKNLQRLKSLLHNVPALNDLLATIVHEHVRSMRDSRVTNVTHAIEPATSSSWAMFLRSPISIEIARAPHSSLRRQRVRNTGPAVNRGAKRISSQSRSSTQGSQGDKQQMREWFEIRPNCRSVSRLTGTSELEDFFLHLSVLAVCHDRAAGPSLCLHRPSMPPITCDVHFVYFM